MPLKFKFKSKDEIPAEHLPLYAEREGAWILAVDGTVDKSTGRSATGPRLQRVGTSVALHYSRISLPTGALRPETGRALGPLTADATPFASDKAAREPTVGNRIAPARMPALPGCVARFGFRVSRLESLRRTLNPPSIPFQCPSSPLPSPASAGGEGVQSVA